MTAMAGARYAAIANTKAVSRMSAEVGRGRSDSKIRAGFWGAAVGARQRGVGWERRDRGRVLDLWGRPTLPHPTLSSDSSTARQQPPGVLPSH